MTTAAKVQAACALSEYGYKYIYSKQYELEPCNKIAKQALAAYLISKETCDIDYDKLLCFIEDKGSVCAGNGVATTCEDSITIAFNKETKLCSYTASVSNQVDNSSFARLTISSDTVYQQGKINVVASSKCGDTYTDETVTGCNISGCNSTLNPYGITSMVLAGVVASNPNGYIKNFTFYHTDSMGDRPLVQRVVDISPATLATWNTCPTCTNVYNATHLVFGSPFYAVAMTELLNNVVKTTLGGDYSAFKMNKSATDLDIWSNIKHDPSTYWAGINPDQGSLTWVNQAGATVNTLYSPRSSNLKALVNTFGASMYDVNSFTTTCGSFSTTLSYAPFWNVNEATSNLDKLEVDSLNAVNTGTLTYSPFSCNQTLLTGVPTTSGTISSVEWRNPANTVISTSNTVIVNTPGVYSFKVTTTSGCTLTQTLTV
jgi:hypothetical protein